MSLAQARAALEWQVELGVSEAIGDVPMDRYEAPAAIKKPAPVAETAAPVAAPAAVAEVDVVAVARQMAGEAQDLEALKSAMGAYQHCELRRGARNLVFSDGVASARLMIIGEAPGRDEDREGRPFVGAAGQLLDKMFAAIGLNRTESLYITNVMPWRPPQNREPTPEEMGMMVPFLQRHVALAAPDVIVAMGNVSCLALLGRKGITRMRGQWDTAWDVPVMPMFHPAYLLRNPAAKREAWADLLAVQDKLRSAL